MNRNLAINSLYYILNIIWYLLLLWGVVAIGIIIVSLITKSEEIIVDVPVALSPTPIRDTAEARQYSGSVQLIPQEGVFRLVGYSGWNLALSLYEAISRLLYVLVVAYLLSSIVKRVRQGQVFTLRNVNYIRAIGLLLVLVLPIKILQLLVFSEFLKQQAALIGMKSNVLLPFTKNINSPNWLYFKLDYDFNNLFLALVILVIAEVFRQGVVIKQENEAFI